MIWRQFTIAQHRSQIISRPNRQSRQVLSGSLQGRLFNLPLDCAYPRLNKEGARVVAEQVFEFFFSNETSKTT
ncbi:MAG: hypothetical protein QME41_01745 [Actinomycetota bacterium]|nr:hypothetical protein [Actinomycetota bacterium]